MSNLRQSVPQQCSRDVALSLQDLPELRRRIHGAAAGVRLAKSRGVVLQAAIDAHVESKRLVAAAAAVAFLGEGEIAILRERAELEADLRCLRRREQDARTLTQSDSELLALERSRAQQREQQLWQARANLDELFKRELSNIEKHIADVIAHSRSLFREQLAAMQSIQQKGRVLQERLRKADADMEAVAVELPCLMSSCTRTSAESKTLEATVRELRRSNCDLLSDIDEHASACDGLRQRCRCIGMELCDLEEQSKEFENQRLSCTAELGRATVEQLDFLDRAHVSSVRHRYLQSQKNAVAAGRDDSLLRRKSHAFREAASGPPCGEHAFWPCHAGIIWREDLMDQR